MITSNAVQVYNAGQLSADVVLSSKIKDGEIVDADIAALAGIVATKLQALSIGVNGGPIPSTGVTNSEVGAAAGIVDTKLATISTAGKVDGAALTNLANTPAGAGQIPPANAPGTMVLLKANSGTNTNVSNTNVDTVSISGLTAKDTLLIIFNMSSLTQNTAVVKFRNSTDNKDLAVTKQGNALTAGNSNNGQVWIGQEQHSSTVVSANLVNLDGNGLATGGGTQSAPTAGAFNMSQAVTTAWTGSWTLAFNHNGVTSGGTFRWKWAVYKILGQ